MSPTMGEWDKQVGHIRAWANPHNRVKIFKNRECRFGRADVFGEGQYNANDLYNSHVGNDETRSIIVPEGLIAKLFVDDMYSGQSVTIVGPAEFCNGMPQGFPEGAMSSIQVIKNVPPPPPKISSNGYWSVVATSAEPSISLTWGSSYEKGKTVTKDDQMSITNSVETSLVFASASVSTTFA